MRFRWLNKQIAKAGGYFWLPCSLCKQDFGGHEWMAGGPLRASIEDPERPGSGIGICPDCTKSGKGTFPPAMIDGVEQIYLSIGLK